MQPYHDVYGDSGVSAYETAPDSITVRFKDGMAYIYTNASVGSGVIAIMKQLATQGDRLNAYINNNDNVKKGYVSKFRC